MNTKPVSPRCLAQLVAIGLLAVGLPAAKGQTTASPSASGGNTASSANSSDSLTYGERRFIKKAVESSAQEVQLAQLAGDKPSNSAVRMYALHMLPEHEQLDSDLQNLAREKGVDIDTSKTQGHEYKNLAKESGADFDKAFVKDMVSDHEDVVKLFERTANEAKDPDIRALANKYLPILLQHFDQAKNLRNSVQ